MSSDPQRPPMRDDQLAVDCDSSVEEANLSRQRGSFGGPRGHMSDFGTTPNQDTLLEADEDEEFPLMPWEVAPTTLDLSELPDSRSFLGSEGGDRVSGIITEQPRSHDFSEPKVRARPQVPSQRAPSAVAKVPHQPYLPIQNAAVAATRPRLQQAFAALRTPQVPHTNFPIQSGKASPAQRAPQPGCHQPPTTQALGSQSLRRSSSNGETPAPSSWHAASGCAGACALYGSATRPHQEVPHANFPIQSGKASPAQRAPRQGFQQPPTTQALGSQSLRGSSSSGETPASNSWHAASACAGTCAPYGRRATRPHREVPQCHSEPLADATATQPDRPHGEGEPQNAGSLCHYAGTCTPCKFFRSRRGCKEEERCRLCHFPHEEMTYSGVRRNMRKMGLEKKRWYEALERAQAQAWVQAHAPASAFMIPPR